MNNKITKFCLPALLGGAILSCPATLLAQPDDAALNAYPSYNETDLEYTYDADGNHFNLWSPGADSVQVRIYRNFNIAEPLKVLQLNRTEKGVWRVSDTSNLQDCY